jgi:hypothetical protein
MVMKAWADDFVGHVMSQYKVPREPGSRVAARMGVYACLEHFCRKWQQTMLDITNAEATGGNMLAGFTDPEVAALIYTNAMVSVFFHKFFMHDMADGREFMKRFGHHAMESVMVDREVARDLFGQKAAISRKTFFNDVFPEKTPFYMDFTGCGIVIDGRNVLRAVVLMNDRPREDGTRVTTLRAIVERAPGDKFHKDYEYTHWILQLADAERQTVPTGTFPPSDVDGLQMEERGKIIMENTLDLVINSYLLYKEKYAELEAHMPPIPRKKLERTRDLGKQVAKLHEFSLFSIKVLKTGERVVPAEDRIGTGEGMCVRHRVRGHLRWQWYPSLQSHKLIWINAHVSPKLPKEMPIAVDMLKV